MLNVGEWDAGSVSLTLQVSDRDRFRKVTIAAHSDTMVLGVRRQDFHLFKQPWTTKLARGEIVRLELADRTKAICGSERPPSISFCPRHDAQIFPVQEQKSNFRIEGDHVSLLTIEDFVLLSPTTYGLIQYDIERLPVAQGTPFPCVLNVFTLVENEETPKASEADPANDLKRAMYVPKKIATFELPRWLAVVMVRECLGARRPVETASYAQDDPFSLPRSAIGPTSQAVLPRGEPFQGLPEPRDWSHRHSV